MDNLDRKFSAINSYVKYTTKKFVTIFYFIIII